MSTTEFEKQSLFTVLEHMTCRSCGKHLAWCLAQEEGEPGGGTLQVSACACRWADLQTDLSEAERLLDRAREANTHLRNDANDLDRQVKTEREKVRRLAKKLDEARRVAFILAERVEEEVAANPEGPNMETSGEALVSAIREYHGGRKCITWIWPVLDGEGER